MREIKFRAYRKGVMHVGCSLEHILWTAGKTGFDLNAPSKVTWMQFAGLIDKNGVEIYEGDILRCNSGGFDLGVGEVKMSEYDDCEEYMHEKHLGWNVNGTPLVDLICGGSIVIGNIYENRELLHD